MCDGVKPRKHLPHKYLPWQWKDVWIEWLDLQCGLGGGKLKDPYPEQALSGDAPVT